MNFNKQDRECIVTPPRSEGSLSMGREMLRGVYPERSEGLSMTVPALIVKNHHGDLTSDAPTRSTASQLHLSIFLGSIHAVSICSNSILNLIEIVTKS